MIANSNTPNEIGHSVIPSLNRQNKRNRLPPELVNSIVSLRLTGQSISQISKQLGVTRATVRLHVGKAMDKQASVQATLTDIIPDAVRTLHECIKAGDGKLAFQVLERMGAMSSTYRTNESNSLTIAINTLMSTSDNSPAITVPHPSGQEGEGDDLKLKVQGQNFQNYAPSGGVIDVEPEK